jgi:hypothetical protein
VGTGPERKWSLALAAAIGLALVWAAFAASAPGDPVKRLTRAGRAAAASIVLRKADLPGPGWRSRPVDLGQPNPACVVKSYSLSALTVTGEAGRVFTLGAGIPVVESDAHVFVSPEQAQRAFAIESKPGFAHCIGADLVDKVSAPGARAVLEKIVLVPMKGLPAAAFGFRIVVRLESPQGNVPLVATLVGLSRGRALGALTVVTAGAPWPHAAVRSLARSMSRRMPKG